MLLPPPSSERDLLPVAARFAVALAALAAMLVFGAGLLDAAAAAETAYLATVGGALLLCLAAAGGGDSLLAATAALAVTAVWVPPAGPVRGAALLTLLAAALALAAARGLRAAPRGGFSRHLALFAPLALAVQVLVRSERLLAPQLDARFLAGLLVLPLVGAAAAAVLVAGRGLPATALAAAVAVLPGPGFNVASTAALAALAAADLLRRPGGGLAGWLSRGTALAAVAAAVFWEPRAGLAALLAGAVLAGGRIGAAGAAVAALAAAVLSPVRAWEPAWEQLALAVLVLPAIPVALRRRALAAAAAALALLMGAAWAVPGPAAAAAPLALLVLLAADRTAGRSLLLPREAPQGGSGELREVAPSAAGVPLTPALWPQAVWSAGLLLATALAAAYPWLRPAPLRSALALAGVAPRGADAVLALLVAAPLAAAVLFVRPAPSGAQAGAARHRRGRPAASAAAALALAVVVATGALTCARPGTAEPVVTGPGVVPLDPEHPRLVVELDGGRDGGGPVRSLLVDSTLSNAAGLPAETPVAFLRLGGGEAGDGDGTGWAAEWTLRAGTDTAEWAARRADVAAVAAHRPPAPWLAWVSPEGFFGQLYRSRWQPREPVAASRLEVVRAPGLPPQTVVHLHRVEVRRGVAGDGAAGHGAAGPGAAADGALGEERP